MTTRKRLWLLASWFVIGSGICTASGSPTADPAAAIRMNLQWADSAFSDRPSLLPFSFVYDGKDSSQLVKRWPREVKDEVIDGGRRLRTLVLTDPETRLEVRVAVTTYIDTPGADWTLYFTNRGDKDAPILEQVNAVNVVVPLPEPKAAAVLHRLNGSPCAVDDWCPFDQPLGAGQRIDFATTNGRSSNVCPFFNVSWGSGGVITAIGWSGQWVACADRTEQGSLRVQAGMPRLHVRLHPGETIRSPRILQLYWSGDDPLESYNLFRQTMFAHILPRIDGRLVTPPIAHMSTSYYELNNSNEQNVLSHLASLQGLGFEMFWLDAYWTGPSGFPNSMGNYGLPIERVEPKDRFPHGLKAVADAVEKEGLGFLLWFEPERVVNGTFIMKENPQWVISPTGDRGLYNLGIPEARQSMTDYLNAAIKAYKLSCLRIDFNEFDPLTFWRSIDAKDPNRVGMAEIRYVEGLYRMWDDILQANPRLFIDNCASGGRRIDLETMSRSIPLWRSDNTVDMLDHNPATVMLAAIKNQVMSAGLNRYVPWSTAGQMGAAPYLFRSGFNAGIAFAEDVRPNGYPRELLMQGIAEGKRIRKYYFGNFYTLSPVTTSPKDWCVLQYHRTKEQDGMVVAFRRPESPDADFVGGCREIDPAAEYEVTRAYSYELSPPSRVKGAELCSLKLHVEQCPGSVVVEYRKLKP